MAIVFSTLFLQQPGNNYQHAQQKIHQYYKPLYHLAWHASNTMPWQTPLFINVQRKYGELIFPANGMAIQGMGNPVLYFSFFGDSKMARESMALCVKS